MKVSIILKLIEGLDMTWWLNNILELIFSLQFHKVKIPVGFLRDSVNLQCKAKWKKLMFTNEF